MWGAPIGPAQDSGGRRAVLPLILDVRKGVPMWPHCAAEGVTLPEGPGSDDAQRGVDIVGDFLDVGGADVMSAPRDLKLLIALNEP